LSSSPLAWNCWNEYLAGEFESALVEIEHYVPVAGMGRSLTQVEALTIIQLEKPDAQVERIVALAAASPHNDVLQGALGYAYGVASYA